MNINDTISKYDPVYLYLLNTCIIFPPKNNVQQIHDNFQTK